MSKGRADAPQHEKIAVERGLPEAIQEERLVLGSLLLDDSKFHSISTVLKPEHFALEKHRTIYATILEVKEGGDRCDRVTVASLLHSRGKLASVDGLSYLNSLDEGMPNLPNISGYVRIIRDKADLRALITAGQAMMNAALIGTDSPAEIAKTAATRVTSISAGMVTKKNSFSFGDTIDEEGSLDKFLAPRKDGRPTGYSRLDQMMYGLEPGLFYVIGGDSSHGKSSFGMNIAANVAFGNTGQEWEGKEIKVPPSPVGYFSLEMKKKALFTRLLCSRAKVSSYRLKKGYMGPEERKAMGFAAGDLASAPLYIDDTKGIGVREFRVRVRRMVNDLGVRTVFVDYLQLLNWEQDGKRSEYEGITYITRSLAECAGEENIAMVALTQFNQEYSRRKQKEQRPTVDACHGSGSIKKDADVVLLLFKLSQAHPGVAEQANRTECIIGKQRDGRTGLVLLDWQGKWTTFTEAPEEFQPGREED